MEPSTFRFADLEEAVASVRAGGLAVFPTETVYGLGANAQDDAACQKIYALKGRPSTNPLIVHVASSAQLTHTARTIPMWAVQLMRVFWPGPLTLILPKHPSISSVATAGLDTVGVRMPNHPIALDFIQRADMPIAAPSANLYMQVSPTRREHLDWAASPDSGLHSVPVLDGGPCAFGIESTIVGAIEGIPRILRHGAISAEAIYGVLGIDRSAISTVQSHADAPPIAPGQALRHYAPKTTIHLETEIPAELTKDGIALLCLQASEEDRQRYTHVYELSPFGDVEEAASVLYHALWDLDRGGFRAIIARPFPNDGLGRSLNDRLRRASTRQMPVETKPSGP